MRAHRLSFFIGFMLYAFLSASACLAQQEDPALQKLIDQALKNNPQVQKAYHQWKAAQRKINVVAGLPDPSINYSYFGESIETRVGPQEQKFGVSQKVPFPGKRSLKKKAQSAQAKRQEYRYLAVKSEVIKQIKSAYYDLFFIDRAIQISREEKEILKSVESVAQRKYESNLTPQQNVVKVQVELSAIMQKLLLLEQNRKSVIAKINRLAHRSIDTPIESPQDLGVLDFDLPLKKLLNVSEQSREELLAARAGIHEAQLETSLAKKDYWPDFTVQYEYIDIGSGTTTSADDGKDAWMTTVSVNIPWWFGKKQNYVYERRQQLRAAESQETDIEDQVDFEVKDLYYQIMAQKDVIKLHETSLLPQAEQAFESSQVGFESGKVSFLDWLDAQRTYLSMRLVYYRSVADYNKLLASLERVVGEDIKTMGGNHAE